MIDWSAEPRTAAAFSLRQVTIQRQAFTLGPLDLDIPAGYVTAVVGANGSGKSTLFRLLLNMEPYDQGQVELLGKPAADADADVELKRRIGYLAELPHAYENSLTAEEKARFASRWYPSWDWSRYRKLLRSFDAESSDKLRKLSKGMRRKVELACVLAPNPELLLLDEPSSGLDPFAWQTMLAELRRFMEQGDRTIVIASHIPDEVKRLADYILFLHRGRPLGFYEKDALFDSWRTIVLSAQEGASAESDLKRVPGVQGWIRSAPGIYQVETDRADDAEAFLSSQGYQILSKQRMELEEILGCLIRGEEARR
ncbi:ABC transporter ATP-binding protein [Cohnella lubricantis]|uniref:ABC transporter ATP-binding protein n=1 Tax=Cohnella lubricantis TaxID=2163172 RepID=A0A841T746_9BACL|nr:ABC transporter ATP-binding protein [Cohnella lubricantis]MBB6675745.1 ABC transporter ATP-binding protein [Cohnella lubricantis]MBP2118889.1 ABC-2 type transport system ATP-binding protein [Cohnella lubricantis]